MKMKKILVLLLANGVGVVSFGGDVLAQSYPVQAIRMIIPFSPGGATDTPGRIIAAEMSQALGRNIIIDNRPGAGGTIGTTLVAQAPADGYTLLFTPTTHVLGPSLYKSLSYDPINSFSPVALAGSAPMALAVHPSLPAKSVKELISTAKANPSDVRIASSGNGSTQHLFAGLFMDMSGAKMQHVPYKGSSEAMRAVLSGEVAVGFSSIPRTLALASSGKLRILGVTSAERSSQLPNIPSISESGLKGYDATLWVGLLAPKGTPTEIVNKLSTEVRNALSKEKVKKSFLSEGTDVVYSEPSKFAEFIKMEMVKWGKVMKKIQTTID